MTDEAKTTEATTPPPATPSTADIERIVNEKIAGVEQSALKKVTSKIVNSLTGKEPDPEVNPIHRAFAEAPAEFVQELQDRAEERAIQKMTRIRQLETEYTEAMTPLQAEYPELKKVPNEVFAAFQSTDEKLSVGERLKKASEAVVSKLGLKKQSEQRRESEVDNASLSPSGSGPSSTSSESPQKMMNDTAKDFFKSRRESFMRTRVLPSPK